MKHLGCQLTPASNTNLSLDKVALLDIFQATPTSGQIGIIRILSKKVLQLL